VIPHKLEKREISFGDVNLSGREMQYVLSTMTQGWLTMGRWVHRFEREFAKRLGVKHALAVSSGTAALHLALVALGVGKGDEVIVPSLTYVATANAVAYCGATPVIVDVDPETWLMDRDAVRNALTAKTKAIIPVHLYGVPCDFDLPDGVHIVEDAAEALGAKMFHELHCGTIGDIGIFSFYGNKTITTGEGGMVVTNNDDLATKIHKLRGQGQVPGRRYWHDVIGFNYRMTDLQGAVGVGQLERLDDILEKRSDIADWYNVYLDNRVIMQRCPEGYVSGNWAMAVQLPDGVDRDKVRSHMKREGVETRPVFYPLESLPMYDSYSSWFNPDGSRVGINTQAQEISRRGLVLPIHTGMNEQDVYYVTRTLQYAIDAE
jgi:perosamine synthetase